MPQNNDQWNTRTTLLARIKDYDDQQAWDEFVSYYRAYIYNVIRRMRFDPDEAEEITQLVLIKMWKKMPSFTLDTSRGKFRSWLSTVIRNQSVDFIRSKERSSTLRKALSSLESEESNIDKFIHEEWKTYLLKTAWDIITPDFEENTLKAGRLAFEGISDKEIAARLSISEATVRVHKKRIKDRLKQEVRRLNYELL